MCQIQFLHSPVGQIILILSNFILWMVICKNDMQSVYYQCVCAWCPAHVHGLDDPHHELHHIFFFGFFSHTPIVTFTAIEHSLMISIELQSKTCHWSASLHPVSSLISTHNGHVVSRLWSTLCAFSAVRLYHLGQKHFCPVHVMGFIYNE